MLDWQVFLTNTDDSQLPADCLGQVYRIRWQVELVFKLWKSGAHLAHTHHYSRERILCQFYARLIGLIIFHWLTAPLRQRDRFELSLPKALDILQSPAIAFMKALYFRSLDLPDLYRELIDDLLAHAAKNKRRSRPSTLALFA